MRKKGFLSSAFIIDRYLWGIVSSVGYMNIVQPILTLLFLMQIIV